MLSIIVPIYNEHESLPELYSRLNKVMAEQQYHFEMILVDDGSSDGSRQIERELTEKDARVRAIQFSRNFGHQVAISAGLDHAQGDAVIMMDGDLQNPPELIPTLVAKWEEGYDIVNTVRVQSNNQPAFKNITANLFYWLINRLANVKITPNSADFRLMDRKVVESFRSIHERDRFLRGLIIWVGFSHTDVPFEVQGRYGGQSKYSIVKMARLALDGITSFSSIPLYFAALIGVLVSLCSFLYGLEAIYVRFFTNQVVEGWTTVAVGVLFLGGVQLIFLGVLGLYLAQLYTEVKARPLYLVDEYLGFQDKEPQKQKKRQAERLPPNST